MWKLIFACGAYLNCKDASRYKVGQRIMTFANTDKTIVKRPSIPEENIKMECLPEGAVANCLIMCPCTVKECGRKVERGWFGKDNDCSGEPVLTVQCRLKHIEDDSLFQPLEATK